MALDLPGSECAGAPETRGSGASFALTIGNRARQERFWAFPRPTFIRANSPSHPPSHHSTLSTRRVILDPVDGLDALALSHHSGGRECESAGGAESQGASAYDSAGGAKGARGA